MPPKLGILAGGGGLPHEIIRACQSDGRAVFVIAFKGQADDGSFDHVPHAWVRLGAAGKTLELLRAQSVEEIILAGSIVRPSLAALRPDLWAAKFFARTGADGLGDDGLLSALVRALEVEEGFRVLGLSDLMPELIVRTGIYGSVAPGAADQSDIAHGMHAAKALGAVDQGQAVIIGNGEVLGRETRDGTDALIARTAKRHPNSGGILVKAVKPDQERRADLPTIGPDTIRNAVQAGLAGIAIEAGGGIILSQEQVIEAADAANLFLVGVLSSGELGEGS